MEVFEYRRSFGPQQVIFREGEAGDCAYIIESGHVEISATRAGAPVVLATLGEGELLGEMALIDEQQRSATATTVDATTLRVISREQVKQKIDRADPVLNLFLTVILRRLRATNRMIELLRQGPELSTAQTAGEDKAYDAVRERAVDQLKLEQALQNAVAFDQLQVFFQPIVAARDRTVAGYEALVRWHHPELGLQGPGRFIGLAEETGLIIPIGLRVLEEACHSLLRFDAARPEGTPPLFMSVNLSPRQIAEPGLVHEVDAIVERTRIDPVRLKLEVTENVLMEDPDTTVGVLGELKRIGVQLAVDDFGTGYSSLSYLHRFPIDVLKIDRSFVSSMLTDSGIHKIVRGIVSLARELGIEIVAEGVEDEAEFDAIEGLGCRFVQGFLFARPTPFDEALADLAAAGGGSVG